jgi:hypothetical protein
LPRKREEKRRKKSKKKKKIIERNGSKILSSNRSLPLKFFDTLFPLLEKLDLPHLCSSQQQTTLEDQNPHTTYIIKKNFLLSVAPTK